MSKHERPEVKLLTKQWVRDNCKSITDRDMGLIREVYKRRLVRRDQLEVLYPQFTSTDFLNKRLAKLYKLHIIDRVFPPVGLGEGSSKQHVCLDRAGAILLGIENYSKPVSVDTHGNKSLPLGWEHRITLNDYECSIREITRKLGASLKYYDIERPHSYLDTKIIPDITCLITCNGRGYLFFLEVDLGTEDIPYVKKKMDSYVNYYMSREWVKEPWAQVFKTPAFPRVLILTENGRKKRMMSLQEYTTDLSVRFHIGCHDMIENILKGIIKGSH